MELSKLGFSVSASGTYSRITNVAVNTKQSLVERTVNNECAQTARKYSFTFATIALPVMFIGYTKATYIICRKKSKGLCIISR